MYHREQFIKAVADFNEGRYTECHDTLESLWTNAVGVHRRFLQGMLQMEFGARHLAQGYHEGAYHQFSRALPKFLDLPRDYMGIDLERLRADLKGTVERIAANRGRGAGAAECVALPAIAILDEPIGAQP
ncbi:MAG: DUF309 domain-containing protein [Bacteroidetes bacterium]|nr:DUF309 domain-containing protein [Bacteroidota bacterium]